MLHSILYHLIEHFSQAVVISLDDQRLAHRLSILVLETKCEETLSVSSGHFLMLGCYCALQTVLCGHNGLMENMSHIHTGYLKRNCSALKLRYLQKAINHLR